MRKRRFTSLNFKLLCHENCLFRYFVDEDVLQRVPLLFLLLGGCLAALQIAGILLQRKPTQEEAKEIQKLVS